VLDASLLVGAAVDEISLLIAVGDSDEEDEDVSLLVMVAGSDDVGDDDVSLLVIVADWDED